MISQDPTVFEKNFPKEDYDKKIYTFTKQELSILNTYHTIKTLGEMAAQMVDNLVNRIALPRIGVEPKRGIGTIYDNGEGTFTVYMPKHWCGLCKNNAAQAKYDEKYYCDTCLPLAQVKNELEKEEERANKDGEQ